MVTAEIRKQLHQYIDTADDKSIEAIYTILKPGMQASQLSGADLEEVYRRRQNFLDGKSQTFSAEEAHEYIRQQAKKNK